MAVADILPPDDKRRYSQTTPEAEEAFRKMEASRVGQSRIRESGLPSNRNLPTQGGGQSPSKYRQLRDDLRAVRAGVEGGVRLTQNQRRYGQPRELGASAKTESKISKVMVFILLTVALCIDIFQIVLNLLAVGEWLVNDIMDVGIEIGFFIWFKILGVNFASARTAASFLGTFAFGELTDGIIPTWTLEISLVILAVKAEEKLGNVSPVVKAALSAASKASKVA